jgi:hypothetical protein
MKLHEIITLSEEGTKGILIEKILPYKKSLYTYWKGYNTFEPVLVVTTVFNAAQYGFIASADELWEAVNHYLMADSNWAEMSEEDKDAEIEVIMFNSMLLKDLLS